MVDTVVSLLDTGHRGPIHALSRRGLLPRHHAATGEAPPQPLCPLPSRIAGLMRRVRQEIGREREQGASWQAIIDGLRPATQSLWLSLAPTERARFLRHVRPWWDVHRHRMAPEIAQRIEWLIRLGRLTVRAARITAYERGADGIVVRFRPARQSEARLEGVQRIINCSGPGADFERSRNPLLRHLLASGQVRPDPLGLGLDVTLQGAVVGQDGAISQRLYAAGPLTKGVFWEITAVPEIRRQCELLAAHLAQLTALHRFPMLDRAAHQPEVERTL